MEKRAHIVQIIPTLRYGGAERVVIDLVNNLDERYFRSTILLLSHDHPLKSLVRHADIVEVEKKGKISPHLFGDIKKQLQELRPDVVHTHLFGADVWGRMAARKLHIPVVTTEHNINKGEGIIKHGVKYWLGDTSNAYVAPSQAVASYMARAYDVPKKNICVIQNGIDTKQFIDIRHPEWKTPLRFLLIGRLVKQKGHMIALEALAKMKQFDWRLTIVGEGEGEGALRRAIARLKLTDRVVMLPPTRDTASVYTAHDIVLVPSLWEGLGLVVMEAMAAGRLVIGSDIGGIPELITHNKTGLLFDAGDVKSLRAILGWCVHNQEKLMPLAEAGRVFAKEQCDIQQMIEGYERVYSHLLV